MKIDDIVYVKDTDTHTEDGIARITGTKFDPSFFALDYYFRDSRSNGTHKKFLTKLNITGEEMEKIKTLEEFKDLYPEELV
mgnify:FL=1|jgi:hypothetical protein